MLKVLKKIPWWGWVAGVALFLLQVVLYKGGNLLSEVLGTKAHAWCPKIEAIDGHMPIIAIFVLIYIFSYIFWVLGPVAVSITKRSNFINYLIGFIAAYLVGFIIFIVFPSYMDRAAEGLMNFSSQSGIFYKILGWVYSNDGGTTAFNLFPSYHCLISIYCYLGVRKQPEISKGFRIYSLIMAILICLSTQFTRQHYILDLISGVGIAIICYVIVGKLNPGEKIMKRKEAKQRG